MNNEQIRTAARKHLDGLTKPVGSLGKLEDFAVKMAEIQGKVVPESGKMGAFVIAADHGINEAGVSMYPKEVTKQMVANFTQNGAGINVLARHCGFDVFIVDAGIASDIELSQVIGCKVGYGTRNFHETEAMTADQLETCLANGKHLAEKAVADGYKILALGDMGISNTTTAAAMAIAGGLPAESIIDKGTGISSEMLDHKRRVILESVERHAPFSDAKDIMRKVGGFELATMAGFILGLKGKGCACMIDGFPVTAGAYMAWLMDNEVSSYLFAGHKSKVKGHAVMLDAMGLEAIVELDMRLGEGTGAVIGGFLVNLGIKIASEMASFDDAGVSQSTGKEENY
ncbi:nicotinate-nucleotide--dimethylbenzimidazole phosphoribosyltransferase [Sediminispirochaeta bajacaliforniensis]|uniref:nicotinate-nucleotide--dimethylbenzimidazole phosphoribosyltransferase n=1 Tax=Sediminispirochaeta bajacaliforniensis TaxID=148 RepID=UPI00036336AD|nr:nicotinate-nucleotide--dimethylbenzimidazole phosphoribosyltransferase [Sediminispirochaeta bajacaliforniensis]